MLYIYFGICFPGIGVFVSISRTFHHAFYVLVRWAWIIFSFVKFWFLDFTSIVCCLSKQYSKFFRCLLCCIVIMWVLFYMWGISCMFFSSVSICLLMNSKVLWFLFSMLFFLLHLCYISLNIYHIFLCCFCETLFILQFFCLFGLFFLFDFFHICLEAIIAWFFVFVFVLILLVLCLVCQFFDSFLKLVILL